jgi:hypothetical protein
VWLLTTTAADLNFTARGRPSDVCDRCPHLPSGEVLEEQMRFTDLDGGDHQRAGRGRRPKVPWCWAFRTRPRMSLPSNNSAPRATRRAVASTDVGCELSMRRAWTVLLLASSDQREARLYEHRDGNRGDEAARGDGMQAMDRLSAPARPAGSPGFLFGGRPPDMAQSPGFCGIWRTVRNPRRY